MWKASYEEVYIVRLSLASCDLAKGPLAAAFLHMFQINKDKILEIHFILSELCLHTSRSFKDSFRYSRAVFVSEMQQRRGSGFQSLVSFLKM